MLLALAAVWGVSFLFIEIALRELAPTTVILFRIAAGALTLGIYVALRGNGFAGLRAYLAPLALMGAFNTAFPFFLITWGQQYIDSGLAAILNASAPIFTAVFAPSESTAPSASRAFASSGSSSGSSGSWPSSASSRAAAIARSGAHWPLSAPRSATPWAASTPADASSDFAPSSSPSAASASHRSSRFRSGRRTRARSAGRPWPPCSSWASPRPRSPTFSTSG